MLLERLPFSIPSPGNKRLKKSNCQLDQVIYEIIDYRKKENRDRGDHLFMLIDVQDDKGKGMIHTKLRDEVMTIFLASIMQKFHVELDYPHHVVPEPSITLRSKNGIRVRVEKRSNL
jgi:cytochrome P450